MEDQNFLVEDWYLILSSLTAKTIFIDITEGDANAITSYYKHKYTGKNVLTPNCVKILRKIELKIE